MGVHLRFVLACIAMALLPAPSWAQAMRMPQAMAADGDEVPDIPVPIAPATPRGVRKLSDGSLSCEQIQAESLALEKVAEGHRSSAEAAQKEADGAQKAMMQSAMSAGTGMAGMGMATSLLGMVPGGSMIGSIAAQAAMQARMSAIQDSTVAVTQNYTRVAQSQEAMQHALARNDHLIDLFLKKGCQLAPPATKP